MEGLAALENALYKVCVLSDSRLFRFTCPLLLVKSHSEGRPESSNKQTSAICKDNLKPSNRQSDGQKLIGPSVNVVDSLLIGLLLFIIEVNLSTIAQVTISNRCAFNLRDSYPSPCRILLTRSLHNQPRIYRAALSP